MKQGRFYFISDDFYNKFDKNRELMQNKETVNGKPISRPCFYTFPDKFNSEILWCVPISSKVEKYQAIYDKKIKQQSDKGIKNPKCETIRFGDVLGKKRAFLIQNMFPVSKEYITDIYVDKNTNEEVKINALTETDIIDCSDKILRISYRKNSIIFGNVHEIYKQLCSEIELKKSSTYRFTENISKISSDDICDNPDALFNLFELSNRESVSNLDILKTARENNLPINSFAVFKDINRRAELKHVYNKLDVKTAKPSFDDIHEQVNKFIAPFAENNFEPLIWSPTKIIWERQLDGPDNKKSDSESAKPINPPDIPPKTTTDGQTENDNHTSNNNVLNKIAKLNNSIHTLHVHTNNEEDQLTKFSK